MLKSTYAVQVSMVETCPTLQTPGAKFYRLESFRSNTSEPAGTFNEPTSASEAQLCTNKNVSSPRYIVIGERKVEKEMGDLFIILL